MRKNSEKFVPKNERKIEKLVPEDKLWN